MRRVVVGKTMKKYLIQILAVVTCLAGCATVRPGPVTRKLPAGKSPALLANCGVPLDEIYAESNVARHKERSPQVERPVVWCCPLRTESLLTVLPHADFIRICRPSDRLWHWTDVQSLALTAKGVTLLESENEVEEFLNGNTLFRPGSQAEAESVLLAFAELCGYRLLAEQPKIPAWLRDREEKQKEAERIDWSTSWIPDKQGWKVSCVLVTNHDNTTSSRYTILIMRQGGLQVLKREGVFFTHMII